jgi:hypothetical protein
VQHPVPEVRDIGDVVSEFNRSRIFGPGVKTNYVAEMVKLADE